MQLNYAYLLTTYDGKNVIIKSNSIVPFSRPVNSRSSEVAKDSGIEMSAIAYKSN